MCIWSRLTESVQSVRARFATSMLTRTFPESGNQLLPNEGATLTYFENIRQLLEYIFYCFIDNDFHLDLYINETLNK